jgi:8-oxo-dGTP diphosphatase
MTLPRGVKHVKPRQLTYGCAMMRIRCVGAIVRDPRRRLLLVRRGHEPAMGTWSLPGGRVEEGESDEEAVARELLEETGLVVLPGPLVGRVERPGPDGSVYEIYDYAAEAVSGRLQAGTDATDVRWVAVRDLAGLQCSPGLVEALSSWHQLY